jgi:hypothetical protein
MFSIRQYIRDIRRNKLSKRKVDQLIRIYANGRVLRSVEDWDVISTIAWAEWEGSDSDSE